MVSYLAGTRRRPNARLGQNVIRKASLVTSGHRKFNSVWSQGHYGGTIDEIRELLMMAKKHKERGLVRESSYLLIK